MFYRFGILRQEKSGNPGQIIFEPGPLVRTLSTKVTLSLKE
jgi:hypothetical protein